MIYPNYDEATDQYAVQWKDGTINLDGEFSADELRAIIALLDEQTNSPTPCPAQL